MFAACAPSVPASRGWGVPRGLGAGHASERPCGPGVEMPRGRAAGLVCLAMLPQRGRNLQVNRELYQKLLHSSPEVPMLMRCGGTSAVPPVAPRRCSAFVRSSLDGVNLSAALHQLALKSRRAGTATSACGALVSDPRFAQLMNSLLQVLPSLEAQNLARTA
ncbi:unnamed protein product [Durusdinium trenchii]|uniref:Uncharacterized protein n=1 Tax=Durusdinium trenchii TaxID=1381693 RepID=A0ABP0SN36_9DINO